jgi:hypothetical protein
VFCNSIGLSSEFSQKVFQWQTAFTNAKGMGSKTVGVKQASHELAGDVLRWICITASIYSFGEVVGYGCLDRSRIRN